MSSSSPPKKAALPSKSDLAPGAPLFVELMIASFTVIGVFFNSVGFLFSGRVDGERLIRPATRKLDTYKSAVSFGCSPFAFVASRVLGWSLTGAGVLVLSRTGWIADGWLTWVLAGVAIFLAIFHLLVACAVSRNAFPPRRPCCQGDVAPLAPTEEPEGVLTPTNHPLYPFYKKTELVEYVSGCIWVAQDSAKWGGLEVGVRMTVVRLDDDEGPGRASRGRDLVLYSPIPLSPELERQVRSVGCVRWIVAPSFIHHMYVSDWAAAFPDARLVTTTGLQERRGDLTWHHTFGSEVGGELLAVPWDSEQLNATLSHMGGPMTEIVLFHVASGTVIVCDLVEALGFDPECESTASASFNWNYPLGSLMRRFSAARPGPLADMKLTCEIVGFKPTALRIMQWPFRRLIPCHGRLVECNAREIILEAFAFALSPSDVSSVER